MSALLTPGRWLLTVLLLTLTAVAALVIAVSSGSLAIDPRDLLSGADAQAGLAQRVVFELRLPRALTAFVAGALLALAGALMQVLLRNPLADPYILGTSGGASVAALALILTGAQAWLLPAGAFFGALFSMMLVFGMARGSGNDTGNRLLLTGVVVAAGWGALINLLLILAEGHSTRAMLFWLMGDLSGSRGPGAGVWVLIAALLAALVLARDLNLMLRGAVPAATLGVAVRHVRLGLYLIASLATASAVTLAGSVAFVGLIVPHLARLIWGPDHRLLLPASALLGGTLLILADTGARTLLAPRQLPVGVITALLGIPVFLYLIRRQP